MFGARRPTSRSPRTTGPPGARRHRRVPGRAARPVRLPARPDPAAAQPGAHRDRDRRDDRAAAGARRGLAHPRLLRLGQPQRQGHLPALHGLVRRQPRAPLAAPAVETREPLRRVMGGPATSSKTPAPSTPATSAGRRRCSTTWSSPSRTTPSRAPARRHARAARLRQRERHLAQRLPVRRHRAARRQLRHPDRDGGTRRFSPTSAPKSCSTPSPSRSTGPRPGTSI